MSTREAHAHPALLRAFASAVRAKIARDLKEESARATALRARVVPKVARAVGLARARGECGRAWLFGSYAWGQPSERSDVDLVVENCRDPDHLAAEVGRATLTEVQVVALKDAPESLRERAQSQGVPL